MNKKKIAWVFLAFSVFAIFVFIGRVWHVTEDYRALQKFNRTISSYLEQQQFSGSVLLAQYGKIIYSGGFGYSDIERSKENTRDTTFHLASVTKQFTGNAVLMLEREGKMSVEDPLTKYFPDCSYADEVTVADLLKMQSGIPDYRENDEIKAVFGEDFMYDGVSRDKLIQEILNQKLSCEPGTAYEYSNSNYYLLGSIIEQVSGKPYEQYITETFLKPLGMMNAGFEESIYPADALGTPGHKDGREYDGSATYSAGGLCASAVDLYKWQNALYSGRFGYDIRDFFNGKQGYEYGISYEDGIYNHQGGLHICTAFLAYDDRNDIQVIVLSNSWSAAAPDVAVGLYDIVSAYQRR